MPPLVGIVADDLTGAADTGIAFVDGGASAVVSWRGAIERGRTPPSAHVVAIDTRSRAADTAYARDATREVVAAFRRAGVAVLYKKIDSTLRGHIGDEVAAAIDAWQPGGSLAIVAPAFPATRRTTVNGHQAVDGVPLARRGFVPALLEEAGIATRRADLSCVRGAALESTLLECRQHGTGAVVCDAETDADLQAIARAGSRLGPAIVWVGSGGLARAMASGMGLPGRRNIPPAPRVSGPLLIVVGSRSAIARAQAEDVATAGVRPVNVPAMVLANESAAAGEQIAREIRARLRAGHDVLVTLGGEPDGDEGDALDNPRLTTRLGELLRPCEPNVGGLILTGGDTAVGMLHAWGTTALRLVEEIDAGVVLSETIGGRAILVVTKAGAFGDRGTLERARERLRE